mgnify:CR=1 FL=1
MELIKKFKQIFIPTLTKSSIDNSEKNYIKFEDTVATLQHYPNYILAISLLEAVKLNQMIDPDSEFVVTDGALRTVCDSEVFETAESLIMMISDKVDEEALIEIKNIERRVH